MKKILTLLCTSLIVLLMIVGPDDSVKAAKPGGHDCGCEEHGIFHLYGAEKNKLVADLLSSDQFKAKKLELLKDGYKYTGAKDIDVVEYRIFPGQPIGITVPFIDPEGVLKVAAFINGNFITVTDPEPE
ncbi:hypothetical protein [Neobacillus niacini]|uniref:hypothetical protein n=1 Tax=Neobacillus niacini TaxID=86668 RepID=UPI00203E6254|nr:hypothetical protein [Neobacillus niacini]MCM3691166.1 hypothetical protein [Neobacillus niacini]